MLIATCPLKIGENRMEWQPLAGSALACCAYRGDVHDYVASQVPPHWHHEWELMLVERGAIKATLAGEGALLRAGQGYFAGADTLHSMICADEGPCRYRSIVFDPGLISGAVGSAFDIKYMRPLLERGPAFLLLDQEAGWQAGLFEAFAQAFTACENEGFGYEFTVRHALSQIALAFLQHSEPPVVSRAATQREQRLKRMVQWFDENYAQPFALAALAGAVHCSARECERIFKELLHLSPKAYLLRRRVAAAMSLLESGDTPVVEVAACCGFADHSYFSKQFRAVTGYSPREYRRMMKN